MLEKIISEGLSLIKAKAHDVRAMAEAVGSHENDEGNNFLRVADLLLEPPVVDLTSLNLLFSIALDMPLVATGTEWQHSGSFSQICSGVVRISPTTKIVPSKLYGMIRNLSNSRAIKYVHQGERDRRRNARDRHPVRAPGRPTKMILIDPHELLRLALFPWILVETNGVVSKLELNIEFVRLFTAASERLAPYCLNVTGAELRRHFCSFHAACLAGRIPAIARRGRGKSASRINRSAVEPSLVSGTLLMILLESMGATSELTATYSEKLQIAILR